MEYHKISGIILELKFNYLKTYYLYNRKME